MGIHVRRQSFDKKSMIYSTSSTSIQYAIITFLIKRWIFLLGSAFLQLKGHFSKQRSSINIRPKAMNLKWQIKDSFFFNFHSSDFSCLRSSRWLKSATAKWIINFCGAPHKKINYPSTLNLWQWITFPRDFLRLNGQHIWQNCSS